jgi:hypothetical protein
MSYLGTLLRGARIPAAVLALIAVTALAPRSAHATYYPSLYAGTRANAMGGAFVAIADDEQAIFMNPAGLAGVKGFTFNYAAADIEVSTDTVMAGLQGVTAFNNLNANTLNMLMGKDIFAHTQFAPSLVMPNFGIAFLSDQQFALLEQNIANPNLRLGYQMTNGIQAAWGGSILPKRMRTRSDLRVGIAAKMMWRLGGYYNLGVMDLLNLTQDPLNSLHALTGGYGRGYGVDLGTQYIRYLGKNFSLATALVMTDVGDTTFADPAAAAQKSDLTWGMAASYKLRRIKVNFAFDYKHLLQDTDFRSRTHTGLELQVPFVSLYGGFDQMNLTYGAACDLWIFRLTAASYAEELAAYAGQNTERRYALRIALKFGF